MGSVGSVGWGHVSRGYQRIRVVPNEFTREAEFISRNIQATRAAYNLQQWKKEDSSINPA